MNFHDSNFFIYNNVNAFIVISENKFHPIFTKSCSSAVTGQLHHNHFPKKHLLKPQFFTVISKNAKIQEFQYFRNMQNQIKFYDLPVTLRFAFWTSDSENRAAICVSVFCKELSPSWDAAQVSFTVCTLQGKMHVFSTSFA